MHPSTAGSDLMALKDRHGRQAITAAGRRDRHRNRLICALAALAVVGTVLCPAVRAAAAIGFVQSAGASNDSVGSAIVQAFPAGNTAGNVIVVAVSWGDSPATLGASDLLGNTYVLATSDWDPGNRQGLAVFYAANIRAGANTVTVSFGGAKGYRRIIVSEYSGVAAVSPVDVTAKHRGAGTTASNGVTSGSATTTASGDLIFGVAMDDSGQFGTITAGTGFTRRAFVNNMDMATEDMVKSTAGATAATFTFSRADTYLAQMVAFKAATGGGGAIRGWRGWRAVRRVWCRGGRRRARSR